MNPYNIYILLDAIGIQRYIFETNTLRIITGSSLWLAQWQKECKKLCENHGSELITSAGGNVFAKFSDKNKAKKFKNSAIKCRPVGLDIAWAEVDGNGKNDPAIWRELQIEIAKFKAGDRKKDDYIQPSEFTDKIGCRFCGVQPADKKGKIEKKFICERCRLKYEKGELLVKSPGNETLIEKLYQIAKSFPSDLEKMVKIPGKEETELLAIVVLDLNEIGTKIEKKVGEGGFSKLKEFSEYVDTTIAEICIKLIKDMPNWKDQTTIANDKKSLRLRPLFLGGDDLVFAMPVSLWQKFIEYFFDKLEKKKLEACAGIMIAKHNFPINQLVEMAEDLCANAKGLVKYKKQSNDNISGFALDWHVHQESVFESQVSIRKRAFVKDITNYTYVIATAKPYLYKDFKKIQKEVNSLKKDGYSNRKLFSLYQSLRQSTENTRDVLVYEYLRNENDKMDKYARIWEWVKQSNSEYPLWDVKEGIRVNNDTIKIFYSKYPDILELKFQELEKGGSDE
jgi:hypothetical protein